VLEPIAERFGDGDTESRKVIKDFQHALRGVPKRDELACQHQHLRKVAHLAGKHLARKPDKQNRAKRKQVGEVLTRDFACGSLRKQSSRDAQQPARRRKQQVRLDQRGERRPKRRKTPHNHRVCARLVSMLHRAIYSAGGYTCGMGSPFLQIKFSVLAVAEQHKEQLLQQCIERAFSGFGRTIDADFLLAQAILVHLGLDGARALMERFREILQTPRDNDREYNCCKFLLRRQLRSLSVEEFAQLTHGYFSPCKLSDDPATAQIQFILLKIAREKSSEMGVLHGLRSIAPSLLNQAASSEDAQVRLLAAELATNFLKHEQATRLLQQLAEDPDDAVREEARWHLESLRDSVYRV